MAALPEYFAQCLADPEVLVLVVRDQRTEDAPTTVATVTARICTGRDVLRYGLIDDAWVDLDHRRHGLCRMLILRLLDFFEAHKVTQLQLGFVYGGAAGVMWQHLGFRPSVVLAQTTVDQLRGVQ
jgi:GNAT superfamily N-acetyltransferase